MVIPKEIRRTMRIREGDPLEIYTDRDGSVIFKKYSLMAGLNEFAAQMCDTLNRTTGRVAVITDRDNTIAVAGAPRRELMDKQIAPELERLMDQVPVDLDIFYQDFQDAHSARRSTERIVLGCVLFAAPQNGLTGGEVEYKLAQSMAGFLGRHMES